MGVFNNYDFLWGEIENFVILLIRCRIDESSFSERSESRRRSQRIRHDCS